VKFEFLQWKEILPFIKKESTRNYPPFRSPFLYIHSEKMLIMAKPFAKILSWIDRFTQLINIKIWRFTLGTILFSFLSLFMIFYFVLNAKVANEMGINGAQLAIPGVTLPWMSIWGMLIAIFVHELGHAGAMINAGYPPKDVGVIFLLFLPLGAGVRPRDDIEQASPEKRQNIFASGIVMNFLAVPFAFAGLLYAQQILWSNWWTLFFFWIFVINLGIAIFNFLVIPPLDGYYIFKAISEQKIQDPMKRRMFMGSSISLSVFLLLLNLGLFGFLL
jgi:Zn-dependent protease